MNDAVSITRDLVRCPSVTPADAGALGVLERLLKDAGFEVHRVTFGEPGTSDIDNLYARIGDEEDISVNGTIKLLKWCAERGEKFDHCVLGEPSNVEVLGDCIKIGRRGSQSGTLYVDGVQGHVAYPHRAANPVPDISRLIVALSDEPLGDRSTQFQAASLAFTSFDVGNPAGNVIPGQARAKFNIRFNDNHTQETLRNLLEERLA